MHRRMKRPRARSGVLAVLTLVLAALISAPAAQAAPVLLSQGRPVTASSTENVGTPASNAVDGDGGTRWSSAFSDPQWLQVDLGSTQQLSQVVVNWEAAYAKAFTIQASTDGATWTSLYSTTTATGGNQTLSVTGSGRYVRLTGTQRATQYGYSLWEFQVFGGGGTTQPGDVLLSYGKSGSASSFQDDGACPGCLPAKAFDHDPATRWATSATTGWVDPGWITVDLGATANVHQVVLQWDPAFAVAYQIQVSNDNANWTSLYSTTTGKGFKETLTVNGSGRYVRMYGTARSNGYGYSLWGFDVYGTGGNPTTVPPAPLLPRTSRARSSGATSSTALRAPLDASKWTAETGAERQQRARVLHEQQQRQAGRPRQPGHPGPPRGDAGVGVPGRPDQRQRHLPVHLGPDQHRLQVQLHLRPRRGQHQGVRYAGPVARVLVAGRQLLQRHAVAQLR